jgi:uroporphyrinogen decarboxylase
VTYRLFLRACRGVPTKRPPAWLMRQAGRYMPEYRALKDRAGGFWNLCTDPDAICEATVFAQEALGADAAIIFSDITVPAWAMGAELSFCPGPVFERPIRSRADVAALSCYAPVQALAEGIRRTRARLSRDVSLIGFIGAPVTLATYLVEGTPGRGWLAAKQMAYGDPATFAQLLERLSEALIAHATLQVEAGCDVLQLFDTALGDFDADFVRDVGLPAAARVIAALRPLDVPIIYFGRSLTPYLEAMASLGADVLGVDWSVSLAAAAARIGPDVALMGNLDPAVLCASPPVIRAAVGRCLQQMRGRRGYIFNLGHGVLQQTPPAHARLAIDLVKQGGVA